MTVKNYEIQPNAHLRGAGLNRAKLNGDDLRGSNLSGANLAILECTNHAKDLNLFVRVAVSNEHAEIDLSKKFGALTSEAMGLLRLAKANSLN